MFTLGNVAGHHLRLNDLVVSRHVTVGKCSGYLCTRKWLSNGEWCYERWFEWPVLWDASRPSSVDKKGRA